MPLFPPAEGAIDGYRLGGSVRLLPLEVTELR
jgi:hypothetical protein